MLEFGVWGSRVVCCMLWSGLRNEEAVGDLWLQSPSSRTLCVNSANPFDGHVSLRTDRRLLGGSVQVHPSSLHPARCPRRLTSGSERPAYVLSSFRLDSAKGGGAVKFRGRKRTGEGQGRSLSALPCLSLGVAPPCAPAVSVSGCFGLRDGTDLLLCPRGSAPSASHCRRLWGFHTNRIIHCVTLCVWLLSLRLLFSRL